jgi:hypothetical protein
MAQKPRLLVLLSDHLKDIREFLLGFFPSSSLGMAPVDGWHIGDEGTVIIWAQNHRVVMK